MSSLLEKLPAEILVNIYTFCPDFGTVFSFAQSSQHLYSIWEHHLIPIYESTPLQLDQPGIVELWRPTFAREDSTPMPKHIQKFYAEILKGTCKAHKFIIQAWSLRLQHPNLSLGITRTGKQGRAASSTELARFSSALCLLQSLAQLESRDAIDSALAAITLRRLRNLSAIAFHLRSGHKSCQSTPLLCSIGSQEVQNLNYLVHKAISDAMNEKSKRVLKQSLARFLGSGRPTGEHFVYFSLMDQYQKWANMLPDEA